MSERWEEEIQRWYTQSRTLNLEYLDLSNQEKPTQKELAHNLAVIFDCVCLSNRIHLKNFKLLLQKNQAPREEIIQLRESIKTLTTVVLENSALPKQERLSLSILKEVSNQVEALNGKLKKVESSLLKVEKLISG